MAVTCRILEPTGDPKVDVNTLASNVGTLLDQFWKDRGKAWYGEEEWHVQAVPLAQLWMDRTMKIVCAEEDGKPAGFLLGLHLSPLFTRSTQLHVEAYYGTTPEVDRALLDYLRQMFGFSNDRQLALPCYHADNLMGGTGQLTVRRTEVYVR
jgi:hypothetical protein